MLIASVELLSILAGLGWAPFNLGRWVERKKQSPTYQPTPTPTPTPLSLADLKELFDNLRNQG